MAILDLDLIVDPNAKLKKEIKGYFEDIYQLEDQLESARNEKLEHTNLLKEQIKASANKYTNEIHRKKRKLLNEVDDSHKRIKVLLEPTACKVEKSELNQMREIELDLMQIKLP